LVLILLAWAISLILPNAAGALTVYLVASLGVLFFQLLAAKYANWVNPMAPVYYYTQVPLGGVLPNVAQVVTSSAVLVSLVTTAVIRNARRDAA
jgi:mannitol-specific phosphotransferase system IIBC component